jgi:hypothetical protein
MIVASGRWIILWFFWGPEKNGFNIKLDILKEKSNAQYSRSNNLY